MGEGGVVAQGFEVNEFDQDVGVLLWVAVGCDLGLDIVHFPLDDFLLGGLVLGLSDEFDEVASFAAEAVGHVLFLEEGLHAFIQFSYY